MRLVPMVCAVCLLLAGQAQGLMAADGEESSASVPGTAETRLRQLLAQAQQDRREGRLYDALAGFRQVLELDPRLTRARLELALTYYALLDTHNARAQTDAILQDPELSEGVRASVLRLQDAIAGLEQQLAPGHGWKRELVLGAGRDDNANFGPVNELIDIGGDLYRVTPGYLPREDSFRTLSGRITHRYQLDGRTRIGQRDASRHWETQLTLYHMDYLREDEFEVSLVSIATGYRLTAPKAWHAGLMLRADHILLGGAHYLTQLSLLPAISWQFVGAELKWENTLMRREFADSWNQLRNSDYVATALSWGNEWQDRTLALRLGARIFSEQAADRYFNNDGYELSLGLSKKLNDRLAFYGKYALRDVEYEGVSPLFGTNREETRKSASLGVLYRFGVGAFEGLGLRLEHTRTERDSTIPLYAYERNLSSLMLEYTF